MLKYLTRPEAAQHLTERGLPITKNTLQKMATVGGGPPQPSDSAIAPYTRLTT